jgi:hypothetical protein
VRVPVVDADAPAFRGGTAHRRLLPKSKYKGLAWDHGTSSWRVRVSYEGKQRHVGRCACACACA